MSSIACVTAQVADSDSFPAPGTTGNASNVSFIGGRDANGNPVRLARRTGHVSNYDEALVGDFVLPDPLKMSDGRAVDTVELWRSERRPEILEFYETNLYGRIPANAPEVTWTLASIDADGARHVEGRMGKEPDGPVMRLTLHLPDGAQHPVPVLLNLSFFSGERPRRAGDEDRFNPRAAVLARGWAFAQIGYGDIQPDRADRWRQGVIGLMLQEDETRPADEEWGTISAWAWGASRVVDYLETVDAIDPKRISITGASRLGKTALWAAAKDERFSTVFSVVPGAMGAALIRRDWGETLDDMAQNFAWQFAGNLQQWVGRWNELPVDQHMLISLIAPRPVYVNGGVGDQWSDPKGAFLAMVAAGPVYELFGAEDLGGSDLPELDHPIISSHMGFHYHSKGHQSVPEDWTLFMDFADKHHATNAAR